MIRYEHRQQICLLPTEGEGVAREGDSMQRLLTPSEVRKRHEEQISTLTFENDELRSELNESRRVIADGIIWTACGAASPQLLAKIPAKARSQVGRMLVQGELDDLHAALDAEKAALTAAHADAKVASEVASGTRSLLQSTLEERDRQAAADRERYDALCTERNALADELTAANHATLEMQTANATMGAQVEIRLRLDLT